VYFPYFMAYIFIGLAIGLLVFRWALQNRQFSDQQRARFLPLEPDGGAGESKTSRWPRIEIYALFFLAGAGLLSSAAVLVVALLSSGG